MHLDTRSLAIELQSARNSVYSALGERVVDMEEKELNKQIYKAYKCCKALENWIINNQDK